MMFPLSGKAPRASVGIAVLLSGLLAGCAAYRPAPLPTRPLAFPDSAALARAATAARLPPLTLDLSRPLTPDALGVIAVLASPDLKAARAKAGVAKAQAFAAGLLPDPVISLGFDKPVGGADTLTALSAAIGFDTSSLYLRDPMRAEAAGAAEQVRLDIAWQEWMAAGQARLLAVRILGLQRQHDLAVVARASSDDMLARTLAATSRGDLKQDDLEARRLAAADAAEREHGAERDLATARLDLNRLLGLAPAVRLDISPGSVAAPPAGTLEALFTRARDGRFDLAALRAGYDSQDARLRQALLEQYPKLDLTLTAARDTGNVRTVGPSVGLTLPLWNRNRGAVAIEQASREQLRAEYDLRLSETRADIAALISGLELGGRQRLDLLGQVEPLRNSVATIEAAAARGDLAWSVAETARQSLTDKEIALAVIEQSLAEQTIALDLAVGAPSGDQPK